jgi:plasmid maintenance system antidote protein VapI
MFSERSIFMESNNRWRLQRQVSLSVLVQLVTLAGLIVGSWVNLQRQLDLVSHDVKQLLTAQEKLCDKLEGLHERTIAHEYRLQTLEQK